MSNEWHYVGDQDLERGGTFYRVEHPEDGKNPAVQVMKAPDNSDEFVILQGHIFAAPEALHDALDTCGYSLTPNGDLDAGGIIAGDSLEAQRLKIEAFFADSGIWEAHQTYVSQEDLAGRTIAEYVRDECFLEAYPVIDGPEGIDAPARTM